MKAIVIFITFILISFALFGCTTQTLDSNLSTNTNPNTDLQTPSNDCDSIDTTNSRDECWVNIVRTTLDDSLCNKVTNMKDDCYDVLAFGKDDYKYCGMMKSEDHKSLCYFAFAESENNYSLCLNATVENIRDECYYKGATEMQDKSYCANITNAYTKSNCDALTFNDLDASIAQCELMETYGGSAPDICWTAVAESELDISYCDNVKLVNYKDVCFMTVALKAKDYTICANAIDTTSKDICYQQVGIATSDTTPCANTSTPEIQSLCEYSVSNKQ